MNARRNNNPAKHEHWFSRRNQVKGFGISRKPGWWKKAILQSENKEGRHVIRQMRRMDSLRARW